MLLFGKSKRYSGLSPPPTQCLPSEDRSGSSLLKLLRDESGGRAGGMEGSNRAGLSPTNKTGVQKHTQDLKVHRRSLRHSHPSGRETALTTHWTSQHSACLSAFPCTCGRGEPLWGAAGLRPGWPDGISKARVHGEERDLGVHPTGFLSRRKRDPLFRSIFKPELKDSWDFPRKKWAVSQLRHS